MDDGPVENDTHGWIEIDVSPLDPGDDTGVPFRLVANRFKSSSSDSEDFIHDPLSVLIQAQRAEGLLEGLEADHRLDSDDPHPQSPPDAQREAPVRHGGRR